VGSESYEIFKRLLSRKHWLYRPWIPFLKAVEGGAFLKKNTVGPVLDLACGDGVFTQCVYQKPLDTGLDLYFEDLKKAKQGKTHKSFVRASAYEMPLRNEYYNTVISVCAIEHMPELDKVLGEVNRVLKPGGKFIFSVPSVYFGVNLLTPSIYRIFGLNGMAKEYSDRKNARSQHFHVLTPEEWESHLKKAGLKIANYSYVLDRRVLLIWSFMGSIFFKPLMYPFRYLKIKALDRLLEKLLLTMLSGTVKNSIESQKEGGYLVVEAVK
jgi:SAM-dependent methyltransferase